LRFEKRDCRQVLVTLMGGGTPLPDVYKKGGQKLNLGEEKH